MERHDGVSKGKYTIGLGQHKMAFVTDREDIYSVCLSAFAGLMEKFEIPYESVGRLEVGTETVDDHSKSVKTFLMELFAKSGNSDVEGIDTINACYSGTAALLNSVAWVQSRSWDGRDAIVVCGDIAEYSKGPARPTGGCGAVAFLVGPNAPLAIETPRSSHFEHAYDFYKPVLDSPYPVVDGKFSNVCYLRSLDICYARYLHKMRTRLNEKFDLRSADYFVFHAPYNKLVQKSWARLVYNDAKRHPDRYANVPQLQTLLEMPLQESYTSRELGKTFAKAGAKEYALRVAPSTLLPQEVGNCYTASLFAGLLSLIVNKADVMREGQRVLCFAYGSGLASTMYSFRVRNTRELQRIREVNQCRERLAARMQCDPVHFNATLDMRAKLHHTPMNYTPESGTTHLFPGTFYVLGRDSKARRKYARVPAEGVRQQATL
ncbi:MAG: hypothetical protein MHM6MM_007652 [Cercozoa sp. M6MM]